MDGPLLIIVLALAAWGATDITLRVVRAVRSLLPVAALTLLVAAAHAGDVEAALADRAKLPPADWWRYYYLTSEHLEPEHRPYLEVALRLVIPSMSRQPILEHCLPVPITPTLHRIDLANLGWDQGAWLRLVGRSPYYASRNWFLQRADWVLVQLVDAHESPAYYELVFGGKAPKTRDEALRILGVNQDARLKFGMIEGASGVSVQRVRLISNLSAARGYAWGTADVLQLTPDQDPLEQPEGDFRHDGEEWIVGCRKLHLSTGTQGALQVYFLANGAGNIVDRAPVDLVVDHTGFRGLREIRTAGSCIQCHTEGLNPLKRNEFKEAIKSGVQALAYYEDQQQLEAFHFADLEKEIKRNNEDFAAIVTLACGCAPEDAALAFQASIGLYDQAVDLLTAARELGAEPAELKLALGLGSAYGHRLGARLSSLAHGGTCPRDAWEAGFLNVQSIYEQWSQSQ